MASNKGDLAAQVALQQVGKPYVWKTQGPDTFDCSGLVNYCYGVNGDYAPPGSSAYPTFGTPVSVVNYDISNLRPGDVLCYDWDHPRGQVIGHVGIYVGDGMMVEALNEGAGVVIGHPFRSEGWKESFMYARRPYPYNDNVTGVDAIVQAIINILRDLLTIPQTNTHRITESANMRTGAGTSYSIKAVLAANTQVNVPPTEGPRTANGYTWRKIQTQNHGEGWVIQDVLAPA
jgi:hypothetical protein